METTIKTFPELTTKELYQLLQLRSEVFVVEQDCVYQDIDGKDEKAIHVIGKKDDNIIAYCRAFKPGDYFENASIGRVVVVSDERINKYGHQIFEASIKAVKKYFNETSIKISAQTYLRRFYETHNFKQIGEEYLEDGIPHIAMVNFDE